MFALLAVWEEYFSWGHNSAFGNALFGFYMPFILFVNAALGLRGEATMIEGVLLGVVLGVLGYALIAGVAVAFVKGRGRARRG